MIWVELNAKIEPFDNVDVRQAMNFAFPQAAGDQGGLPGPRGPARGCMPNIYPGFADESLDLRATTWTRPRSCWPEAGLGGGFKTTLAYNAGDPVQEPIAIIYQTALRAGRRRARAEEGARRARSTTP